MGKDDTSVFNTRTMIIGVSLYVLTAALFYSGKYHRLINSFFLLSAIRDSFLWILVTDLLAMFVVYKLRQGRIILAEVKETLEKQKEDVSEVPHAEDVEVEKEVEEEVAADELEAEEVASDEIEVEEVSTDELEAEEVAAELDVEDVASDDIEVDEDLEAKKE
jgi:hypothetical protein